MEATPVSVVTRNKRPSPRLPHVEIDNRPWTEAEIEAFEESVREKRAKRAAQPCSE
jgi:hypothetical protein